MKHYYVNVHEPKYISGVAGGRRALCWLNGWPHYMVEKVERGDLTYDIDGKGSYWEGKGESCDECDGYLTLESLRT